jgi:hypothetical protein
VVVLAMLIRSIIWCIPHLGVSCIDHNSSRIGAIAHNFNRDDSSSNNSRSSSNNSSSTMPLPHHRDDSMLQLREDGLLRLGMSPTQAEQLTASSDTRGKSTEGPSEGSCTTGGPRQLHHRGGDSHGIRSSSMYVLSQRASRYYSIRFRSIT